MGYVKLWQFLVGTFLVTQILFGVEGWVSWIIPALLAWGMTRKQPLGQKNYLVPLCVWIGLLTLMHLGHSQL